MGTQRNKGMTMRATTGFFAVLVGMTPFFGACGGAAPSYSSSPMVTPAAGATRLENSVFARDPNGSLTEAGIQKILASSLELDLPARTGILPVVDAKDWRGPGPDFAMPSAAVGELVLGLRDNNRFTLVTELMPIPSGALGMEALREIAARYQLRYVLLYRERMRERRRVNPWIVGYVTVLGALIVPGQTLSVDGVVEASLFDVKTGILLFTVRRRVVGRRRTNEWHTDDKVESLRHKAALAAAPALMRDIGLAVDRFAKAARIENSRRESRRAGTPSSPSKSVAASKGAEKPRSKQ